MKTFRQLKQLLKESLSTAIDIDRKEFPELWRIARQCGYSGNHLMVDTFRGPMTLNSYWSGGAKDDWIFYDLGTGRTKQVEQNGTMFDNKNYEISQLPNNVALVLIHSGSYSYCEIYFRADQITKMLPKSEDDLTKEEKIVLAFTASLKSSYAGISNYRFHSANRLYKISLQDWENAKSNCVNKGYLNRAGAITPKGRNATRNFKVNTTWAEEIK